MKSALNPDLISSMELESALNSALRTLGQSGSGASSEFGWR